MATSSYFQICQWYYQIVFFKLTSIIKFCSQTYQQYQILFSKLPVVVYNLILKFDNSIIKFYSQNCQ